MLERDIEREAGRLVRARGGLWLKWVSPGAAGVPDRILIAPGGRVVFVELKQETGRLSNLQRYFRDRLRALGCEAVVTHGWKEVEELVNEILPPRVPGGLH